MIASKTSQNKQDQKTLEFSERIDAILETKFSGQADTSLMKKQILDVLDGDKNKALFLLAKDIDMFELLPESLKHDPDVIKIVIENDPQKYSLLAKKSQQNPDIQQLALKAIVSKTGDIFMFIEILQHSQKKNKKIKAFAQELISQNPLFLKDVTKKYIYEIYMSDPKLFTLIQKSGVLEYTRSGVSLGEKAAKYLADIMQELESNSPQETQNKLYISLLEYLGVSEKDLGETGKKLLILLIDSISIKKKEKTDADIDKDEEEKKKQEERDLLDHEDDEINYSVGPYNYVPLGNTCRVWDNQGSSVAIEKSILENMSERSLENFMNFSKLMKNLGLDFLITKQHRLSQLVTGVNFYDGEGMSEARTLKFLNSVGKNIGVPEETYEDSEGNKKTGCFQTLAAAKMKFRELREGRKVGKYDFNGVSIGNKSIFEKYMKEIGLLVEPYGELSVANWK